MEMVKTKIMRLTGVTTMSDDLTSKKVAVIDNGTNIELAIRLAREFGHVYYHQPLISPCPFVNDMIVADGVHEIEKLDDLFSTEIDLYVFPDVLRGDLQSHLVSNGHRVWGSRRSDHLELHRHYFKDLQQDLGLPTPEYVFIRGLTMLRAHLQEHNDLFVKCSSKFRATMETWHHHTYAQSAPLLDTLAIKFGGVQNEIPFIVETPIDSEIESGLDTFTIDGQYPDEVCQGYEIKNEGIILAVGKYTDQPKQITTISDALSPVLGEYRCRNFLSLEVRIRGEQGFCLEPTVRAPSPSVEAQMELIDNLGEIMWHGANGDLVQPKFNAKFAIECAIHHDHEKTNWRSVQIPEEARRWIKLVDFCELEGVIHIPPRAPYSETVGWVVGLGDTLDEAITDLIENAEPLKACPVTVQTQAIVDALKEIQEAERRDVEFTSQSIPKPSTVLEHEK